jgi:hypothetical protein
MHLRSLAFSGSRRHELFVGRGVFAACDNAGTSAADPYSLERRTRRLDEPMRRQQPIREILGTAVVVALLGACVGTAAPGAAGGASIVSAVASPVSVPPNPFVASDQPIASPEPSVVPPTVSVGRATASPVGTASTGARPTPSPAPTRTPAPASALRTITLADDGTTVIVTVGERVLVELGVGLVWTVRVDDPSVLVRVPGVTLVVGAQGLYAAARAGSTLVAAIGDAACRTAVPPCMVPSRSFSVTVVVH